MANDLVRWDRLNGDGFPKLPEVELQENGEPWDVPPVRSRLRQDKFSSSQNRKSRNTAHAAEADAAAARRRGDKEFAFTREGDAAELRQNPWDWGDVRTWAIIVGMCAAVFVLTAFVYFMPQGRHAQDDGAEPVPQFRGY